MKKMGGRKRRTMRGGQKGGRRRSMREGQKGGRRRTMRGGQCTNPLLCQNM